jgi:hypothetical protein
MSQGIEPSASMSRLIQPSAKSSHSHHAICGDASVGRRDHGVAYLVVDIFRLGTICTVSPVGIGMIEAPKDDDEGRST